MSALVQLLTCRLALNESENVRDWSWFKSYPGNRLVPEAVGKGRIMVPAQKHSGDIARRRF